MGAVHRPKAGQSTPESRKSARLSIAERRNDSCPTREAERQLREADATIWGWASTVASDVSHDRKKGRVRFNIIATSKALIASLWRTVSISAARHTGGTACPLFLLSNTVSLSVYESNHP